jgi:hypothetical protein
VEMLWQELADLSSSYVIGSNDEEGATMNAMTPNYDHGAAVLYKTSRLFCGPFLQALYASQSRLQLRPDLCCFVQVLALHFKVFSDLLPCYLHSLAVLNCARNIHLLIEVLVSCVL